MRVSLPHLVTLSTLLFFSSATALAITFSSWTGGTSTDFNTAANWSPAGVPNTTIIAELDTNSGNQAVIDAENLTVYYIEVGVTNNSGANTTLTIQNGGILNTTNDTAIGVGNLSNLNAHGTVIITGANSTWNSSGNFVVANGGQGNLSILQGGNLSAGNVTLGVSSFGFGSVVVDGTNSTMYASNLQVCGTGNGSLNITNGGYVNTGYAYVGNGSSSFSSSGQFGSVSVSNGGEWTSNDWTYVGYYFPGILTVSNGGQVVLSGLDIGEESGATGEVLVTGAGSSLGTNFGDDIAVGAVGFGNLSVANGGQVNTTTMYIGTFTGGNGTVTVTDSGSSLAIQGSGSSSNLELGYEGDANLTVANGGSVIMDGDLLVGFVGGHGVATQTGGTVTIGGAGLRNLNLANGAYNLEGGTLRLQHGNGIQGGGTFNWAGGTIQLIGDFSTGVNSVLPANTTATFDTNGHGGSWSGNLSGTGALTKIGAGEFVLSGNNTYTGNTTVSAGTLTLAAPGGEFAAGTGNVSVATGATLDGSGNVTGLATINGTLSPGSSSGSGVIYFGGTLTMGNSSTVSLALGGNTSGTQYSAVAVAGNASLAGNLAVAFVNSFYPTVGDTFTLFQFAGAVNGTFANVNLPTLTFGQQWDTSHLYTNGTITVDAQTFINSETSDQTVTAGDNATFGVTTSAYPAPAYQWQISFDNGSSWSNLTDDINYGGTNTANLTVNATNYLQNGNQFRVVAGNGVGGNATSTAVTLNVFPPGYISWLGGLGLSGANAALSATPFADPLPNLARFAMNLGATPTAGELPETSEVNVSGTLYLALQYRQLKSLSGVQVTVESSTDMANWTTVPAEDITQLSDDDANTSRFEAMVPIPSNGTLFLRVRYSPGD